MDKLDEILTSYVAEADGGKQKPGKDQLLGAAFVVVNKDGVVYQGAAGRISSEVDSPPFTTEAFSWIASMTKMVTATCVMQVVESGLIGLDDDVRPLVPQLAEVKILRGFVGADVPYLEENTTPITLRQLLTHTTGFGYGNGDPDLARWAKHIGRKHEDLQGTIEAWNTPLKFTPGQGWYYGTGIDWAGQVLEKLTGQSLGAYMADKLFTPLGMHDTSFRRDDSLPPHNAGVRPGRRRRRLLVPTAYRDADTGELTSGDHPLPAEVQVESGGAGLYTTAADYARLLQALLKASDPSSEDHPGKGGDDVLLLRKESVDEMFKPQLTDVQRSWLTFLTGLFHLGMAPDFEPGMPLDHGISGVINLHDSPGKRRKGSMMWAGLCNGHWFIDRATGIGATLITNVLPQPDAVVIRLWDELERAVYGNLLPTRTTGAGSSQ